MKKLAIITTLAIMASGSSAIAMDNTQPRVTNDVTTNPTTNVTTSTTTTTTGDMKKISKVVASELRPSAGDPTYSNANGVAVAPRMMEDSDNAILAQSDTSVRNSGTTVITPEKPMHSNNMGVQPVDPVAVNTETEALSTTSVEQAEIATDGNVVPSVRSGEMVEDITPEEVLNPNQPMEKTAYDIPGATRTVEPLGEIAVDGK